MPRPGGNKFGAKRTICGAGHNHASGAEARRCDELHLLQRAGEISRLQQQPKFVCQIDGVKVCTYIADFAYFTKENRTIEDVKGHLTAVYKLKKKLVEALHPGVKIVEVRR